MPRSASSLTPSVLLEVRYASVGGPRLEDGRNRRLPTGLDPGVVVDDVTFGDPVVREGHAVCVGDLHAAAYGYASLKKPAYASWDFIFMAPLQDLAAQRIRQTDEPTRAKAANRCGRSGSRHRSVPSPAIRMAYCNRETNQASQALGRFPMRTRTGWTVDAQCLSGEVDDARDLDQKRASSTRTDLLLD